MNISFRLVLGLKFARLQRLRNNYVLTRTGHGMARTRGLAVSAVVLALLLALLLGILVLPGLPPEQVTHSDSDGPSNTRTPISTLLMYSSLVPHPRYAPN